MKKYSKQISFISIVFFVTLYFAANALDSTNKKEVSKKIIKEVEKPKPVIPVAYYPKKLTKNVNHKLDSLLKRINKRHDFHGAILVAKDKKIVYKNQVGYADFRKKIPLKEDSEFQLASVSKQFTAAAIMLLQERNQLKITDTVNIYFPDFPFKNITIKNLLNHTAGLPKYFWVAEHEWKEEKAPNNTEMMELLSSSKVQRFYKPGRNFDYSNTGYFVLASIIEKISKTSFGNFLEQNIFNPLGMDNSYVYSFENDSIHKNQLKGYRLYRGWKHISIGNTVNDGVVGDKNIYSTTEDLYKWTCGLNSGKLLSEKSLQLMYAKGETIYGRKVPYGFGFRIDRNDDKKIYHYGKWNGFSTAVNNYLDDNLVVIVLEHTSYNSLKSLNRKIKKIVTEYLDV